MIQVTIQKGHISNLYLNQELRTFFGSSCPGGIYKFAVKGYAASARSKALQALQDLQAPSGRKKNKIHEGEKKKKGKKGEKNMKKKQKKKGLN